MLIFSLECKNPFSTPSDILCASHGHETASIYWIRQKPISFSFCVSCFNKQLFYPYLNLLTWLSLLFPVAFENTEITQLATSNITLDFRRI